MKIKVIATGAFIVCFIFFLSLLQNKEYEITLVNLGALESHMLPYYAAGADGRNMRVGGAAYLATALAQIRQEHPAVLVVEPGDQVMGMWWNYFQGEPELKMLNALGVNAGMVGNHELSQGPAVLKKQLLKQKPSFPLLLSNVSFSDPELASLFQKQSIIETADQKRVGFFSLMDPKLTEISRCTEKDFQVDGNLVKQAEINVRSLNNQKVDAIVLISHNHLSRDLDLVSKVKGINVVISAGVHDSGRPQVQWVSGPDGWQTAVYSATTGGRDVSVLTVNLKNGQNVSDAFKLEVREVDDNLKPDPGLNTLIASYADKLEAHLEESIGVFFQPVDARKSFVRSNEAPIGDFVTDAIRKGVGSQIAVMNSGGIRGDRVFPPGPINGKTINEILPFQNTIWIKRMKGSEIEQMLSLSVSALVGPNDVYNVENRMRSSGFLQVSGLFFTVSLEQINPPATFDSQGKIVSFGSRVKNIAVLNNDGSLSPLNYNEEYTVAMPDFLAFGRDGYSFLKDLEGWDTGVSDTDLLFKRIKEEQSEIEMKSDGRLNIISPGRAK